MGIDLEELLHQTKTGIINANEKQTTYVTLTYAQSLDGTIGSKTGCPLRLSNDASMRMTHALRSVHECILVGVGTVVNDNPSLTTRLVEGKNPQPVVVDGSLRTSLSCKLITSESCVKPIILTIPPDNENKRQQKRQLEKAGARIIECQFTKSSTGKKCVDLKDGLDQLRNAGYSSVMIEGGASIIESILSLQLQKHTIDQVIITIAPFWAGGFRAIGQSYPFGSTFPRMKHTNCISLENDIVVHGEF